MSRPFKSIVLRTNTLPSGRKYDTVELFGFDMWLSATLVGDRLYRMAELMAQSLGLELRDERNKNSDRVSIGSLHTYTSGIGKKYTAEVVGYHDGGILVALHIGSGVYDYQLALPSDLQRLETDTQ